MDLGGEEDGGNLEVDENIVPRCDWTWKIWSPLFLQLMTRDFTRFH
jgi:hypothetical protein